MGVERVFRNDAKSLEDDAEATWIIVEKTGKKRKARKRNGLPKRISIELKEGGCSIKDGIPCNPEFSEEPRPRKRGDRKDEV